MVWCHSCEYGNCFDHGFTRNCTTSHYCYKSTGLEENHNGDKFIAYKRGCDPIGLPCRFALKQQEIQNNVLRNVVMECCDSDFCNNGSFPQLALAPTPISAVSQHSPTLPPEHNLAIFFGAFLFLTISFFSFVLIYKKCANNKKAAKYEAKRAACLEHADPVEKELLHSDYKPDIKVTAPGDSTLREMLDGSVTSGSGSGFPTLVQRTLAKQIDLKECIGQGRYGEVWKGVFHYDDVAVKIFYSRDEASFQREVEIYSTIKLKNENILPFIGSDVTSVNSCTQLWLVTTYYQLGSLFDYLNANTISLESMFSIMISIVSGVAHLHTEVFGTQGKPAIAHRDLKSKNILMTSPSTCCIADFGLAVTHKQTTGSLNIAFNYRVGTKRYMAPEVLEGTLQENNFLSYTMADIYSLSLVLWEIIRRSESESHSALTYKVPYQDMVPSDPSFDEMRYIVCVENRRPEISPEIDSHPILKQVTNIIRETWSRAPKSRLSALRIKKSLTVIQDSALEKKMKE